MPRSRPCSPARRSGSASAGTRTRGRPRPGHYRFADFAGDVDAVATHYGATRAVGTSLGQGAITHLLGERPDRFERLVFILPAALDVRLSDVGRFDRIAEMLETLPTDEAIAQIVSGSGHAEVYVEQPWLRELDMFLWQDLNATGVARAIRDVTRDVAIEDRELLRKVEAPTLILCQEGDELHPLALGEALADLIPSAELLVIGSDDALVQQLPELVARVATFLAERS